MTPREKEIRQKLKDNFEHYALKCLKIRTKSGEVAPFILNKAQLYIHQQVEQQKRITGKVRAIVLKGRQQGCSTYIEGRYYWLVTHRFGVQAFILTHALDATTNLYRMAQRFHENCPALVRPEVQTSNSKELIFGALDSGYKIGTAENKAVGRSSTIQLFHGSEVAFWANASEHAKGIMQAVPGDFGTEIFLESTANGIGNYFHEQWQMAEAGLSDFIPIFVPWYWQDEYCSALPPDFEPTPDEYDVVLNYGLTYEQLQWRRNKISGLSVGGADGYKMFDQEYPISAQVAFQSSQDAVFITPDIATTASKMEAEQYGALLVGVDPARFGDDRSAIIRRRGRVAFGLETYVKYDTMQIAGICHNIIVNEHPHKMFIDTIGIGAGVYDRLLELGHKDVIVSVNSASTARDHNKFVNKRAEMWHDVREWLMDIPTQIPNEQALLSDLCGVQYRFDSKGRLLIESKVDMKKRGVRSSDTADALCLTFAYPATTYQLASANESKKAHNITKAFRESQKIRARINQNI
jgi:hypothetical protein